MKTQSDQVMYCLYQSWKDSGKGKAICEKEQSGTGTFYYRANKLREKHGEGSPAGFNLLNLTPSGGQGISTRISYPSGIITVELFGTRIGFSSVPWG